mgnify:CR=1 FL=1
MSAIMYHDTVEILPGEDRTMLINFGIEGQPLRKLFYTLDEKLLLDETYRKTWKKVRETQDSNWETLVQKNIKMDELPKYVATAYIHYFGHALKERDS